MRSAPTGAGSATKTVRRMGRCLDTRSARDARHTGLVRAGSERAGSLLQAAAEETAAAAPPEAGRPDFQREPRRERAQNQRLASFRQREVTVQGESRPRGVEPPRLRLTAR